MDLAGRSGGLPKMRIKLSLESPFPCQKILIQIPETIKTVSNLKKHISKSISTVPTIVKTWKEIKLEIEGYEILGGSEIDIISADDVVSYVSSPFLPPS